MRKSHQHEQNRYRRKDRLLLSRLPLEINVGQGVCREQLANVVLGEHGVEQETQAGAARPKWQQYSQAWLSASWWPRPRDPHSLRELEILKISMETTTGIVPTLDEGISAADRDLPDVLRGHPKVVLWTGDSMEHAPCQRCRIQDYEGLPAVPAEVPPELR